MAALKQKAILIYDKSAGRFVDKSDQIAWSKIESPNVIVQYKHSNRTYKYSSSNVVIAQLQDTTDTSLCDVYTSIIYRELQHNPDNHNTLDRWLIATAATYAVVHAA